jgi:phosphinothricin acetyltransferase
VSVPAAIRPLEVRDLKDCARIWNESTSCGESSFGPVGISVEELRAELLDGPAQFESYVWDGGAGGPIAGWVALMRHTHRDIYDTVAELTVFVAAKHRRRGIAKALVRHAQTRASQLGFRVLLLILQTDPAYLAAWAVRLGFRRVGGLTGVLPVGSRWLDIMVFEKFIAGER